LDNPVHQVDWGALNFQWRPNSFLNLALPSEQGRVMSNDEPELVRCSWAGNALNIQYHDEEWGVPVHDENLWFEFLILEGAQAGLSWETILKKRDRYRQVFAGFDPAKVARFDAAKLKKLLADPGIIRNRQKLLATVANAKAFRNVQNEFGSFDAYLWGFVGGAPIQNAWKIHRSVPAKTPLSVALSKDLLKRGFRFVGPTICYALMQATGVVNDHLVSCFRYKKLAK
jgi:DNA-3-methyladenine glycosylase I